MGGGLLQAPNQAWQPSARQFPSLLNEFLVLSGLANRFPQSPFFGRSDRSWADSQQAAVVDWVPGAFAILRRDLIERIGLFDPRFFFCITRKSTYAAVFIRLATRYITGLIW